MMQPHPAARAFPAPAKLNLDLRITGRRAERRRRRYAECIGACHRIAEDGLHLAAPNGERNPREDRHHRHGEADAADDGVGGGIDTAAREDDDGFPDANV